MDNFGLYCRIQHLGDLGQRSLEQVLGVGSTRCLKLAALYDRSDGATCYLAGESWQVSIEEPLPSFDSGDPDVLLETVRWTLTQRPAERYGIVLWSHGSGWRPEDRDRVDNAPLWIWEPEELARIGREVRGDDVISDREATQRSAQGGSTALFRTTLAHILKQDDPTERAICFDDGSSHSLDTLELAPVMRETQNIIGQPLDLLGLGACVMAMLEIAYQVRQLACYLVASEELVPGRS